MTVGKHSADPAELQSLYVRRLAAFRRVAAAVAGGQEEGRDAVQEAFAKALARGHQYRGDTPLEAWVWRIVLNEAKSQRRGLRRLSYPSRESVYVRRAPDLVDQREGADVRAALARLPQRERLALFLRYFADLDYAQIAAVLEVRSGTVGASLHSGRTKLGRLLSEGDTA
jgi:RNA polymerase sigma-70 factor (ECF subfamily)